MLDASPGLKPRITPEKKQRRRFGHRRLTAVLAGLRLLGGGLAGLSKLCSLTWREAQTMTNADAFFVIAVCFGVAALMTPLLRKVAPDGKQATSGANHG